FNQANKVASEVDHLQTLLRHWGMPHVMSLGSHRHHLGALCHMAVVVVVFALNDVLSTGLAALPTVNNKGVLLHQLARKAGVPPCSSTWVGH
ncbi:hypothetical protein KI387_019665, partial [Taxus chinensis]